MVQITGYTLKNKGRNTELYVLFSLFCMPIDGDGRYRIVHSQDIE